MTVADVEASGRFYNSYRSGAGLDSPQTPVEQGPVEQGPSTSTQELEWLNLYQEKKITWSQLCGYLGHHPDEALRIGNVWFAPSE